MSLSRHFHPDDLKAKKPKKELSGFKVMSLCTIVMFAIGLGSRGCEIDYYSYPDIAPETEIERIEEVDGPYKLATSDYQGAYD